MGYSTPNTPQKDKSLKIRTFIYRRLQGNQNSSGLQCEVAYWPALAVGSAAQLAAAQCPNERFWTQISRFRRQLMVSGYVKILLSLSRRCRTIKSATRCHLQFVPEIFPNEICERRVAALHYYGAVNMY